MQTPATFSVSEPTSLFFFVPSISRKELLVRRPTARPEPLPGPRPNSRGATWLKNRLLLLHLLLHLHRLLLPHPLHHRRRLSLRGRRSPPG